MRKSLSLLGLAAAITALVTTACAGSTYHLSSDLEASAVSKCQSVVTRLTEDSFPIAINDTVSVGSSYIIDTRTREMVSTPWPAVEVVGSLMREGGQVGEAEGSYRCRLHPTGDDRLAVTVAFRPETLWSLDQMLFYRLIEDAEGFWGDAGSGSVHPDNQRQWPGPPNAFFCGVLGGDPDFPSCEDLMVSPSAAADSRFVRL